MNKLCLYCYQTNECLSYRKDTRLLLHYEYDHAGCDHSGTVEVESSDGSCPSWMRRGIIGQSQGDRENERDYL